MITATIRLRNFFFSPEEVNRNHAAPDLVQAIKTKKNPSILLKRDITQSCKVRPKQTGVNIAQNPAQY